MMSTIALGELVLAGCMTLLCIITAHQVGWPVFEPKSLAIEFVGSTIFAWYMCLFADVGLHTLGHLRIKGNTMHTIHMSHHKVEYPCGNLLRPLPYRGGGGDKAFGPPVCLIWIAVFWLAPHKRVFMAIFVESATFLFISDYLHMQYHVENSWLEGHLGDWFINRRLYHFHHHHRLRENMSLGGISTMVDRLFGTYWSEKNAEKTKDKFLCGGFQQRHVIST